MEHEITRLVAHRDAFHTGTPVVDAAHDDGVVRQLAGDIGGVLDDPAAFGPVATGGDLNQLAVGDGAVERHQPLIHLTQLGHTQGGIRDEAALAARTLRRQQQEPQHADEGVVVEPESVDQAGGLVREEVGFEAAEDQSGVAGRIIRTPRVTLTRLVGVMALADEPENDLQRVIHVPPQAGLQTHRRRQDELFQSGGAVAGFVFRYPGGQDFQFGGFFGEEDEHDPVEIPQRLPADQLTIVWGEGDACFAVLGGDILADELDRLANRFTQIVRDRRCGLAGFGEGVLKPRVPFGQVGEVFAAGEAHGVGGFPGLGGIGAFRHGGEVDREVFAQWPVVALGDHQPAAGSHEYEDWGFVGEEDLGDQFEDR